MNNIEVFYRDEFFFTYRIYKEYIKVGRARINDIILSDPCVSRRHATISVAGEGLSLFDDSFSGTYVNGTKVSKSDLNRDDRIVIGPYVLIPGCCTEDDDEPETQTTKDEETAVILPFSNISNKSFIHCKASLLITEGPDQGKRFSIDREKITFGKSRDNDFVLTDKYISRYHTEIRFRNGNFFIYDLGSRNGIFINGKRITGSMLYPGSMIEAGKSCIDFTVTGEEAAESKKKYPKNIIGQSKKMKELRSLIEKSASCDATVLIYGETGTGKELVAKAIHSMSRRSKGRLETIDCGSIPKGLIESKLFGHEKGAFTGAKNQRKGAFELAGNGSVFLDEIGELPIEMQPRLLRILEEREFMRVGGEKHISTDIRIIAATNKELDKAVKEGKFREDLFYRLYVIPIYIPPLRERVEDIPLLADYFIKKGCILSDNAIEKMIRYSWPGNVRELRNVIERAVTLCSSPYITADDIRFVAPFREDASAFSPSQPTLEEIKKQTIADVIKAQDGNKKAAAKALNIAYSTMCEMVKKYNIHIN